MARKKLDPHDINRVKPENPASLRSDCPACSGMRVQFGVESVSSFTGIRNGVDGAEFQTEYFVFDGPWKSRICKGLDYKAVNALLAKLGILRCNPGRNKSKQRIPGRGQIMVYHVTSALFEGADHE